MPPTIAIIGRSHSGKTTLIEGLIRHFKQKGRKISIIKHMKHDFQIDYRGKDSYRYREAGADSAVITNDRIYALISNDEKTASPLTLADRYLDDSDIIIIEGNKDTVSSKIEVIGDSKEPPLFESKVKDIIAIVSDKRVNTELPCFKRDEIKNIADFIEGMLV